MQNQGCSNYHESRGSEFLIVVSGKRTHSGKIIHAAGGYISEKGSQQVIYPRSVNNYSRS
jgi:hypothetical protein